MKKALLVGINYTSLPNATLKGCIYDVVNVRNMLIDAYDYNQSDIIMLRDDTTIPASMPTRQNILDQMTEIVAQTANCSEIWIHYSGHGTRVNDTDGDEITGKDSCIVPVDYQSTGLIIDDVLFEILKNIKCRAFIMFDSCYSGSACDLEWSYTYQNNFSYARTHNNNKLITNPNIFMMSGCKDNQTSADSYDNFEQEPVGAFTYTLLKCMRASRHNITIMNLYRNVCASLIQEKYRQLPVLSCSGATPIYTVKRKV